MTAGTTQSDGQTPSEKNQGEVISIMLNYLLWFAAEDPPMNMGFTLDAETSLEWFCQTLPGRPLLEVLRARYSHVAPLDRAMSAFPMESLLAEKVLIPLHQAKVAFIMGHEFGCIALSGMVAEMLATLRFQISPLGRGPSALSERQQERMFGRSFEQTEHSRRVGILEFAKLIEAATADEFMELSRMRNRYLHRLSQSHEEMTKDAIRSYEIAVKLAIKVLGLGIKGTQVTINPEVLAYIREQEALKNPNCAGHSGE